jgi:hypothetical protein
MKILAPLVILALLFCLFALSPGAAWGEDLDGASQDALNKTQNLLNDRQQREAAVKKDRKSTAADQYVKQLTDGNDKTNNEIYELAAQVFQTVVKDANGDPKKMQEALDRFKRNPQEFASEFTPEQRAKLHEIAEKLGNAPLKQ